MGRLRERKAGEEGWTLPEMVVVLVILAVLTAIALPTFVGARTRAAERAAQSSLRTSLSSGWVAYVDKGSFLGVDASATAGIERAITYVSATTPSTGPNVISVHPVDARAWVIAALSSTGTCFFLRSEAGSTSTPAGNLFASSSGGTCQAIAAPGAGSASWKTSW